MIDLLRKGHAHGEADVPGFDEIRERTKMNELDDSERKRLHEQFVKAGGKDISERRLLAKDLDAKTSKRRSYVIETVEDERARAEAEESELAKVKFEKPSKREGFFANLFFNLSLYFEGLAGGVTDISGSAINMHFFTLIQTKIIPAFNEADAYVSAIVFPGGTTTEIANRKKARIDQLFEGTTNYELLERFREIYDESLYDDFLREYARGTRIIAISSKIEIVKQLFRRIYILKKHVRALELAIQKGLAAFKEIEGSTDATIAQRQAVIRKAIDFAFYTLYDKFLLLIRKSEKRNYSSKSAADAHALEKLLDIGEDDRIGAYTERKEESKRRKEEDLRREEIELGRLRDRPKVSEAQAKGYALIRSLVSFSKSDLPDQSVWRDIDELDKIYRARRILDVFEEEYSLVLTTTKIKYNIYSGSGSSSGIKQFPSEFGKAISELHPIGAKIQDYIELSRTIDKIAEDRSLRYELRLQQRQKEESSRANLARSIKGNLVSVFGAFRDLLAQLVNDEKFRKQVIVNSDDRLLFDIAIHGKRKVNGYTISDALEETYYFVCGFHYLLTTGELAGAGLLVDTEGEGNASNLMPIDADVEGAEEDFEPPRVESDIASPQDERETNSALEYDSNERAETLLRLRRQINSMIAAFNGKRFEESRALADSILQSGEKFSDEVLRKSIAVLMASQLRTERPREAIATFERYRSVVGADDFCKHVYEKALVTANHTEREAAFKSIATQMNKAAYDIRNIVLKAYNNGESVMISAFRGAEGGDALVMALMNARAASDKKNASLLQFASFSELHTALSIAASDITKKMEAAKRESGVAALNDLLAALHKSADGFGAEASLAKLQTLNDERIATLNDRFSKITRCLQTAKASLGII